MEGVNPIKGGHHTLAGCMDGLRSVWEGLDSGQLLTCSSPVAVLRGDAGVSGTVVFEQEAENHPTTITWKIEGNDANAKRGFHIHTFGDNTNGCTSAGPHCMHPGAASASASLEHEETNTKTLCP